MPVQIWYSAGLSSLSSFIFFAFEDNFTSLTSETGKILELASALQFELSTPNMISYFTDVIFVASKSAEKY